MDNEEDNWIHDLINGDWGAEEEALWEQHGWDEEVMMTVPTTTPPRFFGPGAFEEPVASSSRARAAPSAPSPRSRVRSQSARAEQVRYERSERDRVRREQARLARYGYQAEEPEEHTYYNARRNPGMMAQINSDRERRGEPPLYSYARPRYRGQRNNIVRRIRPTLVADQRIPTLGENTLTNDRFDPLNPRANEFGPQFVEYRRQWRARNRRNRNT